ncbi:DUF3267 domain-containing protein [Halalkalibacterium halodurans]|uniref:BH1182 protein n=1 Tax=Halalkalibacterium halodurans (strain ATCC BAA-125 / DSM 18197 / FERM 7344 / JCM 9153 / C-125) TaxID=272558 RepID=Q9KDM9_HALH5|nr:DUF3267 domain-containing protein [Halalkalibacterium halodurans]MED4173493.1 DUF3267 domain-containing protein [Halalkalibacterium halodurans]BAB04901.1 BH1182 [Halalkalibacterium halodurans C-125]
MNCWKSINIERDYGTLRLAMISATTMLMTFLVYYLVLSSLIKVPPYLGLGPYLYIVGAIGVIGLHKLLHIFPLWVCGQRLIIERNNKGFLPFLNIKTKDPLSKNLFLFSLLFPGVVITIICSISVLLFPQGLHLFAILTAINLGLAVYDIVYALQVVKAPKASLIENHRTGFHILIRHVG